MQTDTTRTPKHTAAQTKGSKLKTLTMRVTDATETDVKNLAFASSDPDTHVTKAEAGASLLEIGILALRSGRLTPDDFKNPLHAKLFSSALRLAPAPPKTKAAAEKPKVSAAPAPPEPPPAPEEPEAEEPQPQRVVEYDAHDEAQAPPGPLGGPRRKGAPGRVGERPRKRS
jgi:hypothetical protein